VGWQTSAFAKFEVVAIDAISSPRAEFVPIRFHRRRERSGEESELAEIC
jgi:hypothetical protein